MRANHLDDAAGGVAIERLGSCAVAHRGERADVVVAGADLVVGPRHGDGRARARIAGLARLAIERVVAKRRALGLGIGLRGEPAGAVVLVRPDVPESGSTICVLRPSESVA